MQLQIFHLNDKTRCVNSMPMSQVTPAIHPPHHGHTKVKIMVINDQLMSLSFHVNQPYDSWFKAISNFGLKFKVKVMDVVIGTGHINGPVSINLLPFGFTSIRLTTIPDMELFWKKGQCYGWGQRLGWHNWPNIQFRCSSILFQVNRTNHYWPMVNRVFDLKKNISQVLKKKLLKKFPTEVLKTNKHNLVVVVEVAVCVCVCVCVGGV